jgi:hypothetical protein
VNYLKPEGLIEFEGEHNGIPASAGIYFVFDGDWSNMYDDEPATEEEARARFVNEVREAMEEYKERAARQDEQTERSSDSENRGAQ